MLVQGEQVQRVLCRYERPQERAAELLDIESREGHRPKETIGLIL